MTLSQIIAKDSFYDREVPEMGCFNIRGRIINGRIDFVGVEQTFTKPEEKIKKESKKDNYITKGFPEAESFSKVKFKELPVSKVEY